MDPSDDTKQKSVTEPNFFPFLSNFQAETTQADLRPEQQAKHQATVLPYVTQNWRQRSYLYISTGTNRVSVGDRLSVQMSISTTDATSREEIKHLTYLVGRPPLFPAHEVDPSAR